VHRAGSNLLRASRRPALLPFGILDVLVLAFTFRAPCSGHRDVPPAGFLGGQHMPATCTDYACEPRAITHARAATAAASARRSRLRARSSPSPARPGARDG